MMIPMVLAAAASEAGANPLSFDFWTFLFQALNVFIVMFVLYKMLWGPISKIIEERERFVEDSLAKATAAKEEAEGLLARYQEQLRQAEREAQSVVERATKAGEEARQRMIAEADAEAQKMLERARVEINREREKALAEIREEVTGLVMLATQKVVGRALTDEDHKALVRDFVAQVDKADADGDSTTRKVGNA